MGSPLFAWRRWGARASRRTLVEVDQFDSGRRDADRCSRDGRAPHSENPGSRTEAPSGQFLPSFPGEIFLASLNSSSGGWGEPPIHTSRGAHAPSRVPVGAPADGFDRPTHDKMFCLQTMQDRGEAPQSASEVHVLLQETAARLNRRKRR